MKKIHTLFGAFLIAATMGLSSCCTTCTKASTGETEQCCGGTLAKASCESSYTLSGYTCN